MPEHKRDALIKVAQAHGHAAYDEGNRVRVVIEWRNINGRDHGVEAFDVRTWSELRTVLGY